MFVLLPHPVDDVCTVVRIHGCQAPVGYQATRKACLTAINMHSNETRTSNQTEINKFRVCACVRPATVEKW